MWISQYSKRVDVIVFVPEGVSWRARAANIKSNSRTKTQTGGKLSAVALRARACMRLSPSNKRNEQTEAFTSCL